MKVTNRRLPTTPGEAVDDPDERLFAEEGPAGGCASGECLPPAEPADRDDDLSDPAGTPLKVPNRDWRGAIDAVKAVSARHGSSLAFGRIVSVKPGEVRLVYSKNGGFHRATVGAGAGKQLIEKALTEYFRRPTVIFFEERDDLFNSLPPSLAESDAQGKAEKEKTAESRIRTHPAVRSALKMLGGEIEHIQFLEEERPPAPAAATPEDGA